MVRTAIEDIWAVCTNPKLALSVLGPKRHLVRRSDLGRFRGRSGHHPSDAIDPSRHFATSLECSAACEARCIWRLWPASIAGGEEHGRTIPLTTDYHQQFLVTEAALLGTFLTY
jgi:hypothetical protein